MEQFHRGLGEHFERGGIAIANGVECGGTSHLKFERVVGIGAESAVFVGEAHGDECEVATVGGDGAAVGCELEFGWFSSGFYRLFASLIALFVIYHHFNFALFVFHVLPAQTVAVEAAVFVFGDAALTLAVHKQLCRWVVGVAIHWSDLPLASCPSPVGKQVDGVLILVPVAAVEVEAVFWKSGKVNDAKVAAATWPILVVWRRFAEVVETRPHKFASHPVVVVLHFPVVVGQIAPPAVFHIVAAALSVGVLFVGCYGVGEEVFATAAHG